MSTLMKNDKTIAGLMEQGDLIINQTVSLLTDVNGLVEVAHKENYILVSAVVLNDAVLHTVEIFTSTNASLNPTVGYTLRAKGTAGDVYDRATRRYLLTWVRVD